MVDMSGGAIAELQRIRASLDPSDRNVRALRGALRDLPIDQALGALAELLDHPQAAVRQEALKHLRKRLQDDMTHIANVLRERPSVGAMGVEGATTLLAATAASDRAAARAAVDSLAGTHLHSASARAVARAAELDARRDAWEPTVHKPPDGWPKERSASWRNVVRWLEARLGRTAVVAVYLSAGSDYGPLYGLVAEPPDGLPRADLCVYVDRDMPHIPDRSELRAAIDGYEIPFLGRDAHIAELEMAGAAGTAQRAFLLTVRASNEEVCQHANRENWSPQIVVVIRDGCANFGSNLHGACPNDLRRPLLQRPPKWWITEHRIRIERSPWTITPTSPLREGQINTWSVRRSHPPGRSE